MENIYKIKDRINEALIIRGMTAAELANATGLNKSSVSRYLTGENIPRSKAIGLMAQALNVSPAWILGYNVTIDGKSMIDININNLSEENKTRLQAYYQALLDSQKE